MKMQDKISDEVYQAKKILVLKDYDSLFNVYGRETTIVFIFRGWTITLLTVYYGFLLSSNFISPLIFQNMIPLFIIFMFMLLEIGERSIMSSLLSELRNLEKMFMNQNEDNLRMEILKYVFRDIRDKRKIRLSKKIRNYFSSLFLPQILSWYPLILTLNFLILALIFNNLK